MKFTRYLVVQFLAYGLDMGGFLLMFEILDVGPIYANIFGKVIAGIFAFLAHKNFTFGFKDKENRLEQVAKYFMLLGLNIPLSSVLLILAHVIGSPMVLGKIIADTICIFLNFWISKKYIFSSFRESLDDSSTPRWGKRR